MAKTKKSRSSSVFKVQGWNTSDEDEIARRITRAENESFKIQSEQGDNGIYSAWVISGDGGSRHRVGIRSLELGPNDCDCKDYLVNGLGTCKHIEAVLKKLRKRKRVEREAGHSGVEIYLDRRDLRVKISFSKSLGKKTRARQVMAGLFDEAHVLRGDVLQSMAILRDKIASETARVRTQIHISRQLECWLRERQQIADQRMLRRQFEKDLQQGRVSLDMVKLPLYPYQQEGMMHLAFTGRALLADEMGLGKTVQAIAGAEMLSRLHGIEKVLVISPASLKTEWQEQIGKFSDREALIIQGMRKRRNQLYQQQAFFYLANYEQILYDKDYINAEFQPDLIILDEAQRIKNWQTKTSAAIKQLKSRFAFVLTGTPLENRIDEIYSLAQFLDPNLFGPLFRFNRDFHFLDEKGVATGYKNLDQLHERLRPIMLRRRKSDVEGELPERSINNYFIALNEAQQDQYKEYEETVARLAAAAKNRPLKKEERQRLMISLACMRMACDTPFILNQDIRLAPKLDELDKLLDDLFTDPDCKIIVFSEWERMLILLSERLLEKGIEFAWHTGSVTQKKRREEINRFKNRPECRLFLATDSAATGLNLQVARVVVNLDLPWNPAKLEQRIARAWRKHQKHPVLVINLVSEFTIEHRMLSVLRHKTDLADEVVDGAGKLTDMDISAGKGSFMDRLDDLLAESKSNKPPIQRFTERVIAEHADQVTHLEQRGDVALVVAEEVDRVSVSNLEHCLKDGFGEAVPALELLDRAGFEMLQRLADAGVIQFVQPVKSPAFDAQDEASKAMLKQKQQQAKLQRLLSDSEEKQRMSQLLADGGFIKEALAPLSDGLNQVMAAAAWVSKIKIDEPISIGQMGALQSALELPEMTVATIATLRYERNGLDQAAAKELHASVQNILEGIKAKVNWAP